MGVTKKLFGKTKDGQEVYLYHMENGSGAYIEAIDFGAVLTSVMVPDRDGKLVDVVLGYDQLSQYEVNRFFYGATVGRSGNRIANGRFTINGKEYTMAQNENENNLHSGPNGYQLMMWEASDVSEEENSVTFFRLSPDGEQGFPGNFKISVKYELSEENELIIHYMGESDQDTVANMTNHTYFNLAGHDSGTHLDQMLTIYADRFTPVIDPKSIPTGELALVQGTPMDFTSAKAIGQDINADFEQLKFTGGYDHNYACNDYESGVVRQIAVAESAKTGICMEVLSDCPGVQFYAGNFIEEEEGKAGAQYGKHSGFCLETQYYPDSVNQPNFQSPVLKAGEKYNTVTIYKFYAK